MLNRFSDRVPVDNQTGTINFTLDNFGVIAIDSEAVDQMTYQVLSAGHGPVKNVLSSAKELFTDQLLFASEHIPNVSASIKLQGLNLCFYGNNSQRIVFSVFHSDALFLTPDTVCTDFAVGSIILGVRFNVSEQCKLPSITIEFGQLLLQTLSAQTLLLAPSFLV